MKRVWGGLYCLLVILMLLSTSVFAAESESASVATREPMVLEYYYENACAACHPEDDFYAIISEELSSERDLYPYIIYERNIFHYEERERFKQRKEELQFEATGIQPVLIINGKTILIGLDEIRDKVHAFYLDAWENGVVDTQESSTDNAAVEEKTVAALETDGWLLEVLPDLQSSDSVLLYFSTLSCDDCEKMKAVLNALPKQVTLEDGKTSDVWIIEKNIAEGNTMEILWNLFERYGVPQEKQQVPIVFYSEGYVSGVKDADRLAEELVQGKMQNFSLSQESVSTETHTVSFSGLLAAGLVNGLNPCGASMILMLLASLLMAGLPVLVPGLVYMLARFTAYLAMGLGLYRIFSFIDAGLLRTVSRILTLACAALFLVLAVLNLLDWFQVRKGNYGKVRMQLPAGLRRWNRERIEKMGKTGTRRLLPAVFILGFVISAGEFFCTGQVYLAAILYVLRSGAQMTQALSAFLLYVAALCLPGLALVLAVSATGDALKATNVSIKLEAAAKLLTAAAFAVFALVLLFM